MRMAEDHNSNFPYGGVFPQYFCNQHVVSFQSGTVNSPAGIFASATNSSGGINGPTGMILNTNSSMLNDVSPVMSSSNPPGNVLLDPSQGFKHCAALVADWSKEELQVLKQGLATYASEPNIMKYIKIAASLPEKTVRDVAMRCRCMTKKEIGKRRKPEDYYAGKKIKGKKEKIGSSSMGNMPCNQPENGSACSFMMHDGNQNNQLSCEAASVIDSRTHHLLEDNVKIFHQIAINLENNEIQNNIDLLFHTKENITAILNSMSGMPGIMSQMPPLPVYVNENLMHSILPGTSQAHAPGNIHFREEPRCW